MKNSIQICKRGYLLLLIIGVFSLALTASYAYLTSNNNASLDYSLSLANSLNINYTLTPGSDLSMFINTSTLSAGSNRTVVSNSTISLTNNSEYENISCGYDIYYEADKVYHNASGNSLIELGLKADYTNSSFSSVTSSLFSETTLDNISTKKVGSGLIEASTGETITQYIKYTLTLYNLSGVTQTEQSFNGKIKYKSTGCVPYYLYNYTGNIQTFTAPTTGYYQLEVWGAQGGNASTMFGGYGGYSTGSILLNQGEILYVVVGSQGGSSLGEDPSPGYNGGGSGIRNSNYDGVDIYRTSGGGATHIAKVTGLLSSLNDKQDKVIIVAGGGGGASYMNDVQYGAGGHAGGSIACAGYSSDCGTSFVGSEGGQVNGGSSYVSGSFGQGGNAITYYDSYPYGGSGGGGGWYGGGASFNNYGGGGGSSYIGNKDLINKAMYCYNCASSTCGENNFTINTNSVNSNPVSENTKIGNGYAKISLIHNILVASHYTNYNIDCAFSGYAIQPYTINKSGYYLLQTWGAQGGDSYNQAGGYGAYSTGKMYFNKDQTVYFGIGNAGDVSIGDTPKSSYNGGGAGIKNSNVDPSSATAYRSSGGGATHIATTNRGELKNYSSNIPEIIIVSGGGGGATYFNGDQYGSGGNAGGISGNTGTCAGGANYIGTGGNQTQGGSQYVAGTFGQGGAAITYYQSYPYGGSGGGGGFYGGGSSFNNCGAGGGSSYIGNSNLLQKKMYCNNCTSSSTSSTLTETNSCANSLHTTNCSKIGHGFAEISFLGNNINDNESAQYETYYSFTNGVQTFTAPITGHYQLEVWGAQGGSTSNKIGGFGGYSKGIITLNKNDLLYIEVGSQGGSSLGNNPSSGYNGGGAGIKNSHTNGNLIYRASGGGATHIAITNRGQLFNYKSNMNDVVIVAGGGGGASYFPGGEQFGAGGHAGGYQGVDGFSSNNSTSFIGKGALSNSPGISYVSGEFGKGGNAITYYLSEPYGGSGGGGGWYGGGASFNNDGAGGGSGSIYYSGLEDKNMYCYNCPVSNEFNTKTISGSCYSFDPISNCSKMGNGYAKITYIFE